MRPLTSVLFCLGICAASVTGAANSEIAVASGEPAAKTFIIGVSPFLDSTVKDPVYRALVRLIVEELPLGATLEVYDAYNLKSVTRLTVPAAKVFNSPKTRANQFALSIGEIRQFLAQDSARPAGPKPGFDGAILLPQFCDFLAQNRPSQDIAAKLPLLLIGSPLYQDAKEPGFSMVEGYFPSDGHLHASREASVFGATQGDGSPQGWRVYWAYFGDPWVSDLHREKVERFWSLYLERRGARLASFLADLPTALSAFAAEAAGTSAASKGWVTDPLQTKLEMVRVTRDVPLVDWLMGDAVGETIPPSRLVGPIKIGIRWKEDIDLDLYAAPRAGAETLFFQHPHSAEGYYYKDHRSSPGREFEYIEFESPVDVREVLAYVNFYAGSCPERPRGEVRIEFLNRIYSGTFAIAAPEGNQGRTGKSQAAYWTKIPVQQILRVKESAAQEANAAK
ncbi:MAG: hypothetical protein ACLQVY_16385 [Limisphaerales bacterium]